MELGKSVGLNCFPLHHNELFGIWHFLCDVLQVNTKEKSKVNHSVELKRTDLGLCGNTGIRSTILIPLTHQFGATTSIFQFID